MVNKPKPNPWLTIFGITGTIPKNTPNIVINPIKKLDNEKERIIKETPSTIESKADTKPIPVVDIDANKISVAETPIRINPAPAPSEVRPDSIEPSTAPEVLIDKIIPPVALGYDFLDKHVDPPPVENLPINDKMIVHVDKHRLPSKDSEQLMLLESISQVASICLDAPIILKPETQTADDKKPETPVSPEEPAVPQVVTSPETAIPEPVVVVAPVQASETVEPVAAVPVEPIVVPKPVIPIPVPRPAPAVPSLSAFTLLTNPEHSGPYYPTVNKDLGTKMRKWYEEPYTEQTVEALLELITPIDPFKTELSKYDEIIESTWMIDRLVAMKPHPKPFTPANLKIFITQWMKWLVHCRYLPSMGSLLEWIATSRNRLLEGLSVIQITDRTELLECVRIVGPVVCPTATRLIVGASKAGDILECMELKNKTETLVQDHLDNISDRNGDLKQYHYLVVKKA